MTNGVDDLLHSLDAVKVFEQNSFERSCVDGERTIVSPENGRAFIASIQLLESFKVCLVGPEEWNHVGISETGNTICRSSAIENVRVEDSADQFSDGLLGNYWFGFDCCQELFIPDVGDGIKEMAISREFDQLQTGAFNPLIKFGDRKSTVHSMEKEVENTSVTKFFVICGDIRRSAEPVGGW